MPNRLVHAQSLYLRKHADNPIDWWSWCDQAIATARHDNKPIFLSIGYSSCHWCTVMEGEAFSDLAIADYMNTHFLPIKVDREERPDLDSIYMQALQMMTGQGGWPLNIFLAPDDLVPFYGGTYFPTEPRYGRPGFLQVLQAIRRFYDTESSKLVSVKSEILTTLRQATQLAGGDVFNADLLDQGLLTNAKVLAPSGYGNCFPMIPYAMVTLRSHRFDHLQAQLETPDLSLDLRQIAIQRARDLALGGIFDHVAGGFHRYTVDATWTVPHFEKMLYDNGQIVEYLAEVWSLGEQEPAFERAVAMTVTWLQREMTAPEGYFYAAQDADSFVNTMAAEPEEGAFYVWRYDLLQSLLSPSELEALETQFAVTASGNFEGQTVLQRRHLGELLDPVEAALARLFQARYGVAAAELPRFAPARNNVEAKEQPWPGRIPPVTDTKMIVAWNSLMISGLARAAAVWQQPEYFAIAQTAANFILTTQRQAGQLYRLNYEGEVAVLAQAEDYALLIKALLDLHQASLALSTSTWECPPDQGSPDHWQSAAISLQEEFDHRLWSIESGGYFNAADDANLLLRERGYQDNATPSANGIAISNLVRLSLITTDLTYLDRAEQALQSFASIMASLPRACPSLFAALDWYRHATLIRTTPKRLATVLSQYLPVAMGQIEPHLPPEVFGLVCEGLTCHEPALSETQFASQIMASQCRG